MAKGPGIIRRFIQIVFDRSSAKQAEQQMAASLGDAGKKGGENFVRELRRAFEERMALLRVKLAQGLIDKKEFKKQADQAAKEFNNGIVKGMREAQKAGTLTDKEFIKLSRTLKRTGDEGFSAGSRIQSAFARVGVAIAATFTIDKLTRFFRASISAALDAEESINRLNAVLVPLGTNYSIVGREVERVLDRIQATTKFSDEDAREALTALVTGTGDYDRSLKLLDVTAKIAEKRQISMADAAQVTIKASKGLTRGMQDLGISTKETGDIVAKISTNLGNLAEEAGGTNAGKIKRAANLWDEFQEKIGLAILASDGFQDSSKGMISQLIKMNTWVDENKDGIGDLTTGVVRLIGGLLKLGVWLNEHLPSLVTLSRLIDKIRGTSDQLTAPTIEVPPPGGVTPPRTRPPTTDTGDGDRKALHQREALEHDIRVRTLQLEQQLTQAMAQEMVRRQEILGTAAKVQFATMEEGFKKLDQLNLMLKVAGFDTTLIPQVQRTEMAFRTIPPVMETMAAGMQKVADAAEQNAARFSTPWIDAMDIIRNEVEGQGSLFAELGQAWAEGGFKGIVQLAKFKVKENLARVIEELAKAFGSFALGNPAAATLHLKSAAQHGLAATAWKGLAATGGGGSGSAAGGSAGSSTGGAASRFERPESAINIYLTGPGWNALNPEVQKVVHQAGELAKERYGSSTKVRIVRGSA